MRNTQIISDLKKRKAFIITTVFIKVLCITWVDQYSPLQGFARVHTGSRRPERGSLGLWCYSHPPKYPASFATWPWQHLHAILLESRPPSHYNPRWGSHWLLESINQEIITRASRPQQMRSKYTSLRVLPRSSGVWRTELWSLWSSCRCVCECVRSLCSAVSVAGEGVWEREPPRECMGDALSEPRHQRTHTHKRENTRDDLSATTPGRYCSKIYWGAQTFDVSASASS